MKEKKSYGKENDINLKLVIALMRTTTGDNRRMLNFLAHYNLTQAQFGVLEALYHLGDLKICELLEKTLSTSGNMTVVVKNLEKNGLVERIQCTEDKRSYLIHITDEGRALIDEIFPPHLEHLRFFFSRLSMEEKDQLMYLLKKLNGVID